MVLSVEVVTVEFSDRIAGFVTRCLSSDPPAHLPCLEVSPNGGRCVEVTSAFQTFTQSKMNDTNQKSDWFERIWAHREESLYPALFGNQAEGIFTIPMQNLEKGGIADPRWASCGVIRFAPTDTRSSWLYVSSGLSNEWFDSTPDRAGVSGFGCEFVLETPTQEQWPIQRLHQIMCYQIALCLGQHPDSDPMTIGDRIPLGNSIDFRASDLRYLLVTEPTRCPPTFNQDSGRSAFLQLIGISESERAFAEENGFEQLIERLKADSEFPTTDPARNVIL